jgi:TIR domain
VFWDRTILPGKTWRQVIDTALHEARCVIVAWSEASIQSSWVCEEADEGRERKVLVPVLLGAVKPPRGFRAIQAASLVNWDGRPTAEEFQQLVSAVADILGSPKQPAAPRLSPERSEPVPAHKPESPSAASKTGAARARRLVSRHDDVGRLVRILVGARYKLNALLISRGIIALPSI